MNKEGKDCLIIFTARATGHHGEKPSVLADLQAKKEEVAKMGIGV